MHERVEMHYPEVFSSSSRYKMNKRRSENAISNRPRKTNQLKHHLLLIQLLSILACTGHLIHVPKRTQKLHMPASKIFKFEGEYGMLNTIHYSMVRGIRQILLRNRRNSRTFNNHRMLFPNTIANKYMPKISKNEFGCVSGSDANNAKVLETAVPQHVPTSLCSMFMCNL